MAITHVSYCCLTMLLACLKIHKWKTWEDEAHGEGYTSLPESVTASTVWRHSTLMKFNANNAWNHHGLLLWSTCFIRQFGYSVGHVDYLTLRKAFIMNHNLTWRYDFHCYMVRSVEDDFKTIVGVSVPLWGFVIAFMFFDINGSNLYFWAAIIPVTLVVIVGTKLQYIIATLTLENDAISGFFTGARLRPRDELFWFGKPELVLSLIHFVLFQNAFELAYFFWFWWQFGYDTCLVRNRWMMHIRLVLGFAGLFLCSYSTLPLYVLVTQMGSNYKAALIPSKVQEMVREWGSTARRKRKQRFNADGSVTSCTSTSHFVDEELAGGSFNPYVKIGESPPGGSSSGWSFNSRHNATSAQQVVISSLHNPTHRQQKGVSRSASMSVLM